MITREEALALLGRPAALGRALGFSELNEYHDEWVDWCWKKNSRRALQACRGSYKTSSVIITGISRALMLMPDCHIGLIRKTFSDAADVVKSVSKIMRGEAVRQLYHAVWEAFPVETESSDSRLSYAHKTHPAPEANLNAFGIGGAITGAHLDVIILDDIITLADRVSEAERRKTLEFLQEVFGNIAKAGATVIVTGTPWHPKDAWEYIGNQCELKKYPVQSLPFMDTPDVKKRMDSLAPALASLNYRLEYPADTDKVFSDPQWGDFPEYRPGRSKRPIMHIDAAYGGGDTTALTVLGGNHVLGKCWNVIGKCWEGSVQKHYGEIKTIYDDFKCLYIYCETNADKGFLAQELRAQGMAVMTYHESRHKAQKIQSVIFRRWKELLFDPRTDDLYMEQILDWTYDTKAHDDAPDSLASALARIPEEIVMPRFI